MAAQPLHPFAFRLGRSGAASGTQPSRVWLPRGSDQIPESVFEAWRSLDDTAAQAAAHADFEAPPAPLSIQMTSVTMEPSAFNSSVR